jgi:multiple sugar transport system permease protein
MLNTPDVSALRTPRFKVNRRNVFLVFVLGGLTLLWLLPTLWTLSLSLRTEASIRQNLTMLLPIPFTLEHYGEILKTGLLPRWLLNSLIVASSRTIVQIFFCSMAAFAFARIPMKGKRALYLLVLLGMMIPFQAIFIPLYLLFADLKLHNTFAALILPGIPSAFAVFLLVQFFKGIPKELDEAAYMDGASRFTVYWKIIMPLSIPVLTTLAIFIFLGAWNEYLWPLVSATQDNIMTVSVGLRKIRTTIGGHEALQYGKLMAAAWIAALPIVAFFLVFQRKIISGIHLSSGING